MLMAACLHSYRFLDMIEMRLLIDSFKVSSLGLGAPYFDGRWELYCWSIEVRKDWNIDYYLLTIE